MQNQTTSSPNPELKQCFSDDLPKARHNNEGEFNHAVKIDAEVLRTEPRSKGRGKKYILGKFPTVRTWYQGNGEVVACLCKQLLFYGSVHQERSAVMWLGRRALFQAPSLDS